MENISRDEAVLSNLSFTSSFMGILALVLGLFVSVLWFCLLALAIKFRRKMKADNNPFGTSISTCFIYRFATLRCSLHHLTLRFSQVPFSCTISCYDVRWRDLLPEFLHRGWHIRHLRHDFIYHMERIFNASFPAADSESFQSLRH